VPLPRLITVLLLLVAHIICVKVKLMNYCCSMSLPLGLVQENDGVGGEIPIGARSFQQVEARAREKGKENYRKIIFWREKGK
jgi:hypothetical protein